MTWSSAGWAATICSVISGYDTLDYSKLSGGVIVDLHAGMSIKSDGGDTLSSFERVLGTAFNDDFTGNQMDNVFVGGDGRDTFRGRSGADTLTGGLEQDTFVYLMKDVMVDGVHQGVDTITDFRTSDVLDIRDLVKGLEFESLNEVVQLRALDNGKMLSVKMGEEFVDVAQLVGFSGENPAPLAADGVFIF